MRSPLDKLAGLAAWQINAIGLLGCAALAGVWYLAGFSPLAEARAARLLTQAELSAKRDELAHLARKLEAHEHSLERIKTEAGASAVKLEPVERALDRISELSKAASAVGLTLDEIKPGQPEARSRFTMLPIHLAGTGAFPGVAALLHTLRERFPDTGVKGFELRGEPEHADKPARFTLDLVWYAAKLSAPPAQKEPREQK